MHVPKEYLNWHNIATTFIELTGTQRTDALSSFLKKILYATTCYAQYPNMIQELLVLTSQESQSRRLAITIFSMETAYTQCSKQDRKVNSSDDVVTELHSEEMWQTCSS